MSVDNNLYLGYYFDIKPIQATVVRKVAGCPFCEKTASTKYCGSCGAEIGTIPVTTETKMSIYTLLERMGDKWEEFLCYTDQMCGQSTIYVLNHRGHIDIDDRKVVRFNEGKVPEPDDLTKEFLAAFKKKYGEDSIKMDYGIVYYFS